MIIPVVRALQDTKLKRCVQCRKHKTKRRCIICEKPHCTRCHRIYAICDKHLKD